MGDLNERQRRFVANYVTGDSATDAAIKAGYSPKTARSMAADLLTKPNILAAVDKSRNSLQIRTEITQDRVLKEVALLAFSDVTHYQVDDFGNLAPAEGAPEGVMRAVSSIKRRTITDSEGGITREVEFRLWDKPGIIKLAGRHVGLFPGRDKEAIAKAGEEFAMNMLAQLRAAKAAADAAKMEREAIDVNPEPKAASGDG